MRNELIEILRTVARKFYDYKCMHCGETGPRVQLDHIFPQSIWDARSWDPDNVQLLCADCNAIKGTSVVDYRSDEQKTVAHQMDFRNEFLKEVNYVVQTQKQLLLLAKQLDAK